MLLQREKCKEEMWILMYIMTLEGSLSYKKGLENVIQLGWLGTPTNLLLSQLVKLGIDLIKNYDSSWMKMTLNRNWVSRIVLMMELFLWTFCE